jgi:hypothetical protein
MAIGLGALAVGLGGGGVRVDAAEDAPDTAGTVVLEIAAGEARDSEALAQVARELLGRLSVEVRATQVARIDVAAIAAAPRVGTSAAPAGGGAREDPPLARVWIDWRATGRATLYLLDARRDRLLVRQVERPVGGEELAREELGHILQTACEGLLAGGEVGVPRAGLEPLLAPAAAPPPAAVVVRAAAQERAPVGVGPRWQVAVLYEAALLAAAVPVTHGPTVAAFAGGRAGAPRFGVWATAQLRVPVRADDVSVGVAMQSGALRALFAHERPMSARAVLRLGVGGGVDVVRVTPETAVPERAVLEDPRTLALAVARAAASIDVRIGARAALVAALAVDVDVSGQRYVFARGAGEQLVLQPYVVRPSVAVGVAFP